MPKPNSEKHNPDPEYLRSLIDGAGLSQRQAAKRIGITDRSLRFYLDSNDNRKAPYTVQYALENL